MSTYDKAGNISSAEMTAYWRSQFDISGDNLSGKLATAEGKCKASEFVKKFAYPLIGRKVSIRARFFLDNAVSLLESNRYDSCISFASGFSLLTYFVLLATQKKLPALTFIDTDLLDILSERATRIENSDNEGFMQGIKKIKSQTLNLELACQERRRLKDLFPHCQKPVFLIEGVIYFLTPQCVDWLLQEIATYQETAVIFDYWPEEGVHESQCFSNAVRELRGFMRENVVSFFTEKFWSEEGFSRLIKPFNPMRKISIKVVENQLSIDHCQEPKFIDQNQFFPVKLFVGTKTS